MYVCFSMCMHIHRGHTYTYVCSCVSTGYVWQSIRCTTDSLTYIPSIYGISLMDLLCTHTSLIIPTLLKSTEILPKQSLGFSSLSNENVRAYCHHQKNVIKSFYILHSFHLICFAITTSPRQMMINENHKYSSEKI